MWNKNFQMSKLGLEKEEKSESEVTQSCPTLCDPMDCSLPGSSIHGILQARVLEWVTISFSRGSSRPRDWTGLLHCRQTLYYLSHQGSNQRSNFQHLLNYREKLGNSIKTSTSVLLTMPKPLTVWIIVKCGKLLKRWEYHTILPVSWEFCV